MASIAFRMPSRYRGMLTGSDHLDLWCARP
jgi:hypothetical protein